jgi:phosphoglycolate phosphatase
MLMNLDLWIFDFNGVIIADTQACYETDCHVIKAFGGRPPSLASFRDNITIPAIDFYVRYGCKREDLLANLEKLGITFHLFYEERAAKCRTRKGVRELLQALKKKSIPAVILSNHTASEINDQLKRLKLDGFFQDVLANSAFNTSMIKKNKLGRLEQYFEEHDFIPEESIIIGDSPEEIEIGKKLGMVTVAVSDGYYARWRLRNRRPNWTVANIGDLARLIS